MAADIEQLLVRYRRLKADRAPWDAHWEEVAAYSAPRRLGFTGPQAVGNKRMAKVYNPIGLVCVQTLASAIHGMVMNPAHRWMELRMMQDDLNERRDVIAWLDDTGKRFLNMLQTPSAGFHVHANQALEDIASVGTAVLYFGQQDNGSLYVRSYSIGCCVVAENRFGVIDTVMRESESTVRQVVQQWGPDAVSQKTREKWEKGKYDDLIKVIHSVRPRERFDPVRRDRLNMPWESCYFETEAEHLLDEGGVEEMPYVVPRWSVATGDVYGRSPGMTALPAVKVANEAQRLILHASEKAVDPPLQVPHEGVVSPVRATPGGLTYVRNRQEITLLPTSSNLPYAAEWLQELNNEIRSIFMVDQLQFTADFRMTATEVMERQAEKMRLLAPVLGRLENEMLNPMVTRVFGMLARMRVLPEPPADIQDFEMRVVYASPLARAQKQQLAQGFIQAMSVLEPLAKVQPEAVLGPISFERLTPLVFEWFGVDPDTLKTPDEMAHDARRTNMMQMLQMLPQLGQAMAGGGQGIESLASAGLDVAQIAQVMQGVQQNGGVNMPGMGQMPMGSSPATLLGSLARGAAQGVRQASGTPRQLRSALAGR